MSNEALKLILYPVNSKNISSEHLKEIILLIKKDFKSFKEEDFDELKKSSQAERKTIASQVAEDKKLKYFLLAKDIVEIVDFSKPQIVKLAEVGKLLNVGKDETEIDFDIYNIYSINKYEFNKVLKNFSTIAAAIGFIPILPISDFTILAALHIGMISKISNIYEFKLEAKQFLRMIAGTIGAGILFKITSKILCSFLFYIGWVVNASVAYAGTYAIGILTKTYIEEKGELTKDSIKNIWEKSYEEGKEEFWKLKDYILSKKDELINEFEKYKEQAKNRK